MKRCLGVLMAFCMLFTLIPSQVFAADEPAVTVGNAEVTLGSATSVSVPVSAANLNKVAGLIIRVSYPADALSVKEGAVAYETVFESQVDNAKDAKNPLQISWNAGSAKEVTYNGKLCDINFDVLSTAKAGDYDITVEVYDAALNGGQDITDDVKVTNGKVTIKDNGGGGGGGVPVSNVAITYVASPTEGGTVSGATTATVGAEVTVTATPKENYKLVKITAGDTEVTGGKFTVPTGVTTLTVTATFEKTEPEQPQVIYPALTIGNAEATLGTDKTVAVSVSAKDFNKIAGLIIQITYPEGLSVKEGAVAYKNAFESQNDNAKDGKNPMQIAWNAGSARQVTYEGELCTITFDVLDSAKAGTYDITAKVTDAALNGGTDVTDNVIVTNGKLTIKGSSEAQPQPKDVAITYVASPAEGGTVSGVATAKEGAEVTVTAAPKENYKLVKITAGNTEVTGGKFTVPTGVTTLTVTATFEKIPTEQPQIIYPALTIGNAEAKLGTNKTVSVPISVKNLSKVAGLIIQVTYPEGLSVKEGSVVYKNAFESQNDNAKDAKNPVQIAWNAGSAKEVTYEGELCTITFDVLDSAKAGTYDITAKVTDAALNGGADITDNVTVTKGTLTITGTPAPGTTEYEIEYAAAQHGKISGVAKSAADKDISVTVQPDTGYKLDKLTVNGKDITGTTFKMPAEKVKVEATFVEDKPAVTEYEIEYATAQNGKISGTAKATVGADVAVTVEPNEGYKLDKLTVNGTAITGTTFKMPAEKVKVEATFVEVEKEPTQPPANGRGCYIATSVYGSYDTPEVWTLRRFRDDVLGQTWYGRLFIKAYYATSPTLVRLFGNAEWFQNFWRDKLDTLVQNLQDDGFESTPYQDKDW